MLAEINKFYVEFVKTNGCKPNLLLIGVKEANEIMHLVGEGFPGNYEFGFQIIERGFGVLPRIVCTESLIKFEYI